MKISCATAFCMFFFVSTLAYGYQISFTPGITISEEYNDNIFLTPDNEEEDYITLVAPTFDFEINQRGNGLSLVYSPGYSLYANNSEFNSWRHDALLSAWFEVTRNTRVEFENAYLFTEDPLSAEDVLSPITDDPLIQDDPTIRRGREPYYTNTATARMIHQFGASDSFFIGYSYNVLRNDDPEVDDVTRHIPSMGITYWFLPRWGVELEGSFTDTELEDSDDFDEWHGSIIQRYRFSRHLDFFVQYEHTSVEYSENLEEDSIDYQVYEPSLGLDYTLPENFLFSLRVGYFKEDRDTGEDGSGPSGDITLTKTLRNGSISVAGSAGQENTVLSAENLGFTEFYEIGGSAEYNLLRNVVGDISASFRNAVSEEVETDREDDIITAGIGLTYEATNWLATRLEYRYRSLESTLPEDEYTENRVLFNVTFTKPRPYQWSKVRVMGYHWVC